MQERRTRVLEAPSGTGQVYAGAEWIAEVRYLLIVTQPFIIGRSASGTQELPGLKDVSGDIRVLRGERDLMVDHRGPYTLRLGDGRSWGFVATHGDANSGTYDVRDASADGIAEVGDTDGE